MDVYAPSWPASATPSGECYGGYRDAELYRPSLQGVMPLVAARPGRLPAAAGAKALYAPSVPGTAGSLQAVGWNGRTAALYAPTLQASAIPVADTQEFGGLVEAAYWGEGIDLSGAGRRDVAAARLSMYDVNSDVLTMLYALEPEPESEPVEEPPRELSKVSMPRYRIEPPDLLVIEALKLVPRPPYRIEVYDVLMITASGTLPNQPIGDYFLVDADGTVKLGPGYKPFRVVGMTIDEATAEITKKLREMLLRPSVSIRLIRSASAQQVSGIYELPSEGAVNIGRYGQVYLSGKTVAEASAAIERHLSEYFDAPEVTVEVIEYKSKSYYVVIAGAESGESVLKFPLTGSDTVLDAVSYINGLPYVSSKTMWVARPAPGEMTCEDILPVDYAAITRGGMTDTNYQLLPGDRLYIVDDRLVATGAVVDRFLNPIERMLNISRLGSSAVRNAQVLGRSYNQRRGY